MAPFTGGLTVAAINTVRMLLDEHRQHFKEDAGAEAGDAATQISHRVLARNHDRVGLALSGGGIRSATFALGVLQALAELRLLTSIHFLSTVSGGGYIGSWLSAWAHRHPAGIAGVMEELRSRQGGTDHEAAPVRHLRRYSNYLTPRVGLLSADTWTLIGTCFRNLLVNWLTLVPYFLLALLVPVIGVEMIRLEVESEWFRRPWMGSLAPVDVVLIGGLCCLVYSIGVLGASLPTGKRRDVPAGFGFVAATQTQFLLKALVPLLAGVIALVTAWAAYTPLDNGALLLTPFVKTIPQWAIFTLLGIAAHLAASIWYTARTYYFNLATGRRVLARTETSVWLEPLAIVLSGAFGGWLVWLSASTVVPAAVAATTGVLRPLEVYVVVSVPLFLLGFLLAQTLYIALGSRLMGDEDREWFARAGAWILAAAVGWVVISSIALLGPDTLRWLWRNARASAVSIGGLSGIVSMWLGRSDRTRATDQSVGRGWGDVASEWALTLAAPAFLVTLAIIGATALEGAQALVVSLWSVPTWVAVAAITGALLLVVLIVAFAVNVNVFSLHGMYRDRLIRAYLGASRSQRQPNQFTGFDPDDNLALAHLAWPFFNAGDWPLVHTIAIVMQPEPGQPKSALRQAIDTIDPDLVETTSKVVNWNARSEAAVQSVLSRFNYLLSSSKRCAELRGEWDAAVAARFPRSQFGAHDWWTIVAIARELHPDRDMLEREPATLRQRFVLQTLVSERDRTWIAEAADAPFWEHGRVVALTGRLNAVVGKGAPAAAAIGASTGGMPSDLGDVAEAETMRTQLEALVPPPSPAPLHIVNTTINLVSGDELAWQERRAASFTMTPFHAGSPVVGFRAMKASASQRKAYGGASGVSLGTAVTISGAAANPNMGYHSSPVVTLLLTLFNARLGAWLGNPAARTRYGHSYPRRQFFPMALAEAFGMTSRKGGYVHLSDGGHFENLGLYELVRRGCGHVIVSDAGCDGSYAFEDLGNAVRKIRVDLGIEITFTGFKVGRRPAAQGDKVAGEYVALGTIHYGRRCPGVQDGELLYVKPAIFDKDEPIDVVQYGRANPAYPHEPTTDQWFSESQFESYRALGKYIMLAVSAHKPAAPPPDSIGALFGQVKAAMAGASGEQR
jgi:hypothetical protein